MCNKDIIKYYKGWIITNELEETLEKYEDKDTLLIERDTELINLFDILEDECGLYGDNIMFQYASADYEFEENDFDKLIIDSLFGLVEIGFELQWGWCTTCAYYDYEQSVGGHDIKNILSSLRDKYCIIKITYKN
jgi:hypothetical protein